jgi:hypothetical protein
MRRSSSPTFTKTNGASSFPVFDPANVAGSPFAFLMFAVFAMPSPVRMYADFAHSGQLKLVCRPTEPALPCLLHNVVTVIAAIYSGGCECRGQLQIGQVFHRRPANCAFGGRCLWYTFLGHGLYTGGFNSPKIRFCIAGVLSGSGTSQSMQRNLRPPDCTSMNLFGLPHLEQAGGGVFLAMARSRKIRREPNTLCHR